MKRITISSEKAISAAKKECELSENWIYWDIFAALEIALSKAVSESTDGYTDSVEIAYKRGMRIPAEFYVPVSAFMGIWNGLGHDYPALVTAYPCKGIYDAVKVTDFNALVKALLVELDAA